MGELRGVVASVDIRLTKETQLYSEGAEEEREVPGLPDGVLCAAGAVSSDLMALFRPTEHIGGWCLEIHRCTTLDVF